MAVGSNRQVPLSPLHNQQPIQVTLRHLPALPPLRFLFSKQQIGQLPPFTRYLLQGTLGIHLCHRCQLGLLGPRFSTDMVRACHSVAGADPLAEVDPLVVVDPLAEVALRLVVRLVAVEAHLVVVLLVVEARLVVALLVVDPLVVVLLVEALLVEAHLVQVRLVVALLDPHLLLLLEQFFGQHHSQIRLQVVFRLYSNSSSCLQAMRSKGRVMETGSSPRRNVQFLDGR